MLVVFGWRNDVVCYAYSLSLLYKLDLNDHIVQYMYDAVLHKHVLQTSVAEGVQIIHSSQRHKRQDVQTIILTYPGVNRAVNQVHSGQWLCVFPTSSTLLIFVLYTFYYSADEISSRTRPKQGSSYIATITFTSRGSQFKSI